MDKLTKADERSLKAAGHETRFWRGTRWIVMMLPLLWLAWAVGDLLVACRLGAYEGDSLWDIAKLWYASDSAALYSGLQLEAVKRVESAFGKVLLAIVFVGIVIGAVAEWRQRRRIYHLLCSHRLLDEDRPQA